MKRLISRYITVLIHVLAWLCLFIYPFVFNFIPIDDGMRMLRAALLLLLLITFFYSNSSLLIPKFLAKKRFGLYFLFIGICIAATSAGNVLVHYALNPDFDSPMAFHETGRGATAMNTALFASLLIWLISSGWKITSDWFKNERLKKEMEKEKLASELAFLKSQVNPHFLFNSLNSIYSLANKKSEQTAEAIIKLSDMMRYMLYDSSGKKVGLDKEVEYLKNYIELQKLRVNGAVSISFDQEGDTGNKQIAPLLLVPFVENAFKHGISSLRDSFVHIHLSTPDTSDGYRGLLVFKVENSSRPENNNKGESTGIGLKNVKRRLDLLYPGRHLMKIENGSGRYTAELQLEL